MLQTIPIWLTLTLVALGSGILGYAIGQWIGQWVDRCSRIDTLQTLTTRNRELRVARDRIDELEAKHAPFCRKKGDLCRKVAG